jgi:ABC-2 type transport system ATP-binding protein
MLGAGDLRSALAQVGYMAHAPLLYDEMTGMENLRYFAALYGVRAADATADVEDWLERFRVPEYRDRKVEELSKGNQQKIQFIAAILHDPDVLIMDEPFSGLDPVNAGLLKEAFLAMRDRGKTLIFSTHQLEQVEELCESIALIDRGRLIESGPVREVKRRMGRQVVRLSVERTDGAASDGDGAGGAGWVDEMPGVTVTRRGEDYVEMHVSSGTDPESVLRAAIDRGDRVTRFEIADPSLEEIFIEKVGHRAIEEERHLAEGARAREARS